MDCRYCHTKVEQSAEANVPNAATCMGCHSEGLLGVSNTSPAHNDKVAFVREAYAKNESIEWRRVHKTPDYVRNFPHNVHVKAGVSCYSCHGMIARMPIVHQVEPMSMGWCLDCHRSPQKNLVDPKIVTNLFAVEDFLVKEDASVREARQATLYESLEKNRLFAPPENCGACHY